jgi:long-chain acyl-CoA synthetase
MTQAPDTINMRFAAAAFNYPARPALSTKQSGGQGWQVLTYAQVNDRVRRVALGLQALGIAPGDRVALLSENRPEWVIADLAILAAGSVSVPIYPTLPASQVAYILGDSGAKAVVVSDAKQLAKAEAARDSCPDLHAIVVMDADAAQEGVLSLDALIAKGDAENLAEAYETRRDAVTPDDLMSIIYTSGTTGNPKGVMLSHRNMAASLDAGSQSYPQFVPPYDSFLSFLPLCHIFERVVSLMTLTQGAHTYFNDSIFKIVDNMADVHPNVMVCVPRVFESIHERIEDGVAKAPPKRRKLFAWALAVGDKAAQSRNAGHSLSPLLAAQHMVANKLVLSKARARFGGALKFFVSGGAPLNPRTAHFFNALGVPILEVWGLTEVALATSNPYGRAKVGTVGKPATGVQVQVASDGELLVKSKGVMQGYWHLPEATAEAIDGEGWFHSGDIGEIDSDGYVKITDRKKDILVLANGKKVAPQQIETILKHSPYISEIVLLGDKSETVKALVVPNFDALKTWAKEQGQDKPTNETLVADPAVRKLIKADIDKRSKDLADFEKVRRFALIDHTFSIEAGELTPTLKVKRKVVAEKYGALLEKEQSS